MARRKIEASIDTQSGSRAYNRFDMQVSQVIHMAIELYDEINYLLILDHYDDISLFELDSDPLTVSYYQMKTSENRITIDSAVSEDWLSKLYSHLDEKNDWLIKELGLITNTPLDISWKVCNTKDKKTQKISLKDEKTSFICLSEPIQNKIKEDIANKKGIAVSEVDLSKFAHIHTTLTIDRHRDLAEKEVSDFLAKRYPRITLDTVKSIYSSLIEILTNRQGYESLSSNAEYDEVRKHKGFTREELSQIIDSAIMMSLPEFEEVKKVSGVATDMHPTLSLAYVNILADSNNKDDSTFHRLYKETLNTMKKFPHEPTESAWEYGKRIARHVHMSLPIFQNIYDENYISVLVICLIINELRRSTCEVCFSRIS